MPVDRAFHCFLPHLRERELEHLQLGELDLFSGCIVQIAAPEVELAQFWACEAQLTDCFLIQRRNAVIFSVFASELTHLAL
jgi:hypothetical protein